MVQDSSQFKNRYYTYESYNYPTIIDEKESFQNLSIYPNPSNNIIWVEYFGLNDEEATICVKNLHGQNMLSQVESGFRGNHLSKIDISLLPAGNYYVHMKGKNGMQQSIPFIKK